LGRVEQVLPGIWRWEGATGASGEDRDRCGTAIESPDGLVLVDPPPLPAGAAAALSRMAGSIRHVVLTSPYLAHLAQPFDEGVAVWAPFLQAETESAPRGRVPADGMQGFAPGDVLPGGLTPLALPFGMRHASDGTQVALHRDQGDDGALLITGDAIRVVGQTPVYREGDWASMVDYQRVVQALLEVKPAFLLPAHHAAADDRVARATGYAASIGTPSHERRAAPVTGPRYLVPHATRVLTEVLQSPVIARRAPAASGGEATKSDWIPDPYACTNCGRPNEPAIFTCGGPLIPRMCPICRAGRRQRPAAYRIMACGGGCCTRIGARAVLSEARLAAAELGLTERVDVVSVSCLGECSIGPLVGVAEGCGGEPAEGTAWRVAALPHTRTRAAMEGEQLDEASERVLARFAAFVDPAQVRSLVGRLASTSASERKA
ncbi:MAG TPA: hypothetical protein VNM48_09980, partial [Chloroflexota bacterium]|nr:hypothetical protein [Chloroflexota bacterium]